MSKQDPSSVKSIDEERVTFNFRAADIKVVIDMIARVSDANIIVPPEIKGAISLSISNIPWKTALDLVVKTLGYEAIFIDDDRIRIERPRSRLY